MRVIQMVPSLCYGDAVGNNVIAIGNILKDMGYKTQIFSTSIDPRVDSSIAKNVRQLGKLKDDDVIIYHLAIGHELNRYFADLPGRKVIIYHNVTPSHFFEGYDEMSVITCKKGRVDMELLANKVDYAIAVSEYNKSELVAANYKCPIDAIPILIQYEDYDKKPDEKTIKKYSDGYVNVLFTGRIVPNKKQEDVIEAFAHYQKYYNEKSRLILVGSHNGMDKYYNQLNEYATQLGVKNLIFPGHIKFSEILAFYKVADLFLCMSEHEGFCVPLIEAMYFDVAIIAYDGAAVGETLGVGGLHVKEKNPLITAGLMDRVVNDADLRAKISKGQKERLDYFGKKNVEIRFRESIKRFIENE